MKTVWRITNGRIQPASPHSGCRFEHQHGRAFAATDNDFVDNAAAGGIAEIETSRLALEKSQSADIKAFANMMITDHAKANDELATIAKKNDIEVPDTTTLVKQAKEKILDMRDESFDAAYANNQVKAHEDTIELFKKQANTVTDDKIKGATELKGFAQKMLPGLEKHLAMAKKSCRPPIPRQIEPSHQTKKDRIEDAVFFISPRPSRHRYRYRHPCHRPASGRSGCGLKPGLNSLSLSV